MSQPSKDLQDRVEKFSDQLPPHLVREFFAILIENTRETAQALQEILDDYLPKLKGKKDEEQ